MSNLEQYFYGQGEVLIAKRSASAGPTVWRKAWDVSALTLALATEQFTHKESYSGLKQDVREIEYSRSGTVNATLHNINTLNLALTLYGEENVVVGGSVTDEAFPADLVPGNIIVLDHPGISDLVITDSTGATLSDDHYLVQDAYGSLELLSLPVPAPSQPFKAAYMHAGVSEVGIFAQARPEIALRYNGINLAEGGAPVVVDLWRLSTGALSELALINNDQALAGMPITCTMLADPMRPANGKLGRFGRIGFVETT